MLNKLSLIIIKLPSAVGTAMFIVSPPFSASGENVKEAFQKMMAEAAKFTFARALGDLTGA